MREAQAFKKWREGLGLSQAQAAVMVGVTRVTVARWEKGGGLNDKARALVAGEGWDDEPGEVAAPVVETKPARKVKAGEVESTPRDLVDAMKRDPMFAKTSAEAFAMRDELHRRALRTDKEAMRSRMPLIPLQPDWQSVQARGNLSGAPIGEPFKVNAAIPQPKAWARTYGPRGVVTVSGAVYDFETAHMMKRAG